MGLIPTLRYNRLSDIPVEKLTEYNIHLVFLDMDNTLAPWHSDSVPEIFYPWVENVKNAVDTFVGDAPQFDDLTMLAIQLY